MPDVLQLDDQFPIVADAQRAAGPLRVLKSGDTFGVFDQHGDVSGGEADEQGLYYHGTRFLSLLELRLARRRPLFLSSAVCDDNVVLVVDLTNVDVRRDHRLELPRGEIHVFRSRVLGERFCIDRIRICNHSMRTVEIPLSIRFDADFADVFEVRGTERARRGERLADRGRATTSACSAIAGSTRSSGGRGSGGRGEPDTLEPGVARFTFSLEPHADVAFEMRVSCEDEPGAPAPRPTTTRCSSARARQWPSGARAAPRRIHRTNR